MTNAPALGEAEGYSHSGNLAAKAAAYWMFERLVGDGKRWEMSQRYHGNVTLQAFQALVADYHEVLAPGTPNYGLVNGPGGPYQAGHFDNRAR